MRFPRARTPHHRHPTTTARPLPRTPRHHHPARTPLPRQPPTTLLTGPVHRACWRSDAIRGVGTQADGGTTRRRRHPPRHDPRRRRLVAGLCPGRRGFPVRLRPRRRPHRSARSPLPTSTRGRARPRHNCHTLDISAWTDQAWTGRPLAGGIVYELHVGTFTPAGTFDAAIERLDHLVNLGVTFVQLMPINGFNGTHNWGYDGVLWYTVHEPYGGPDGLQRFVDACHRQGLAVLLDVVYNHLGPSGNYLPRFGPYFAKGETCLGSVDQPRGRRIRPGPRLHHRQRAALVARLPHRRPTPRRRSRPRRHHRHTSARGTRHPQPRRSRPTCAGR